MQEDSGAARRLTVLVYASNPQTTDRVIRALGEHPLPDVTIDAVPVSTGDAAIARLRTLRLAVTAASQHVGDLAMLDIEVVLTDVLDQIDPVRTYLAENEFSDAKWPFLECRRAWFARKGGVA